MIVSPFVDWPAAEVLVLASKSPRRAELLQIAGIPFEIFPAGDIESQFADRALSMPYKDYVELQASVKAEKVASEKHGRIVLGSDTIVVLDNEILEKPVDQGQACEMLSRLSGRRHIVVSAISISYQDKKWTGHEQTSVEFLPMSDQVIREYVETGEPMDKAGAYGIQGYGAMMVKQIEGCYFNVMGLPLSLLGVALNKLLHR